LIGRKLSPQEAFFQNYQESMADHAKNAIQFMLPEIQKEGKALKLGVKEYLILCRKHKKDATLEINKGTKLTLIDGNRLCPASTSPS
jgi:hypothetical protein